MSNQPTQSVRARLALEDGSVFIGTAFGDTNSKSIDGEVCFNTSLTGYQEILTDPSYAGQIVTMTYPLIGNYGVNQEDIESRQIFARGFVVRRWRHAANQTVRGCAAAVAALTVGGCDCCHCHRRLHNLTRDSCLMR